MCKRNGEQDNGVISQITPPVKIHYQLVSLSTTFITHSPFTYSFTFIIIMVIIMVIIIVIITNLFRYLQPLQPTLPSLTPSPSSSSRSSSWSSSWSSSSSSLPTCFAIYNLYKPLSLHRLKGFIMIIIQRVENIKKQIKRIISPIFAIIFVWHLKCCPLTS